MDTEEHIDITDIITRNQSPSDKPFPACEPCKPSSKDSGKAYRTVAYTGLGAVIGAATAAALVFSKVIAVGISWPVIAGGMAAGLLHGMHKYDDLRRIKNLFIRKLAMLPETKRYAEIPKEKQNLTPVITVVYPLNMADFPASDTYPRDKLAMARLALLNLDPSKTIRQ